VTSFVPGIGSCECSPAGGLCADAPEHASYRAESRALSDSGATGLPVGGLAYWERRLVELDHEADIVRKQLYRDRKAAFALAAGGENFLSHRDSVRLRKECAVAIGKVLDEQRKAAQQGYEMAKAREQEKWVVRQERTAKALGLIRAGRHDEALLELEGAAN